MTFFTQSEEKRKEQMYNNKMPLSMMSHFSTNEKKYTASIKRAKLIDQMAPPPQIPEEKYEESDE